VAIKWEKVRRDASARGKLCEAKGCINAYVILHQGRQLCGKHYRERGKAKKSSTKIPSQTTRVDRQGKWVSIVSGGLPTLGKRR
jgi:hypothetical protein